MNKDLWIFGYGSIIWRVDFAYSEQRPAFIKNWARRFWQGSTDHRGVPEQPGRVVTLIAQPGEICWGRAYKVESSAVDDVLSHLDYREKGGYDRLAIEITFSNTDSVHGITYHATQDNPNFLGEASDSKIAQQIINSHGPSGSNIEYLDKLHESLKEMNASDPHVTSIANHARALNLED